MYETDVRGLTMRHPDIPEELRGTYSGLGTDVVARSPAAPRHPPWSSSCRCTSRARRRLVERGLRNYWGYNSIVYLAPHNEYASYGQRGQQVQEFKQMVKTLHGAGIEVILDVVYNHTAEGDQMGPALSFRGIDNAAYYRLTPTTPGTTSTTPAPATASTCAIRTCSSS